MPPWSKDKHNKNLTNHMERYGLEIFNKTMDQLAKVRWETNFLTREGIRSLLANVDAFVLPTRGEGWGLPIAEAMAMTLPVIVTNYSGCAAYLRDDNSYPIS
jgi:glycosyltransferase involved in cell wall biosynthesis